MAKKTAKKDFPSEASVAEMRGKPDRYCVAIKADEVPGFVVRELLMLVGPDALKIAEENLRLRLRKRTKAKT